MDYFQRIDVMATEKKLQLITPDQKMVYGVAQVLGQYRQSLQKDMDWSKAALVALEAMETDSDSTSESPSPPAKRYP